MCDLQHLMVCLTKAKSTAYAKCNPFSEIVLKKKHNQQQQQHFFFGSFDSSFAQYIRFRFI